MTGPISRARKAHGKAWSAEWTWYNVRGLVKR